MLAKIVKIGNSRGIRLPRTVIEQVGITDEVELIIKGDQVIIQAVRQSRQGWEEAFVEMAKRGDDRLLDEITPTQWDEEEWTW